MKVVWPTGTRVGSEFTIRCTLAALNRSSLDASEYVALTPGRNDSRAKEAGRPQFKEWRGLFEGTKYLRAHNIQYCKVEHPGKDLLTLEIAREWPQCRFVAPYRSIRRILESHGRLSWGQTMETVARNIIADLKVLEILVTKGRLFVIPVERPEEFNSVAFLDFLGAHHSDRFAKFCSEWPKVNTSQYQIEKSGEAPKIDDFQDKVHRCIGLLREVDEDYKLLVKKSAGGD